MTTRSIPSSPLFLYPNVAPRPVSGIGAATIENAEHSSNPYSPEFRQPRESEFLGLLEEMLAQLEREDSESLPH